jgi:hypothetical protein
MYPHTLVQLAALMHDRGYSDADLARVVAAHELAIDLFSGLHRPSGDPLLGHLVGTAGIMAELGRPTATVVAGLLHAAYPNGDFGDGVGGASPRRRARVREAVGADAEQYVYEFAASGWNEKSVRRVHGVLPTLAGIEREVVAIRLANALDDCLDRPYLTGAAARHDRMLRGVWPLLVDMAAALGHRVLAAELQRMEAVALPPAALPRRDGVFRVAPASYRLRWRVALGMAAARNASRLRAALGAFRGPLLRS